MQYDRFNLNGKSVIIETIEGDRIKGTILNIEHPSKHAYRFVLANGDCKLVVNGNYISVVKQHDRTTN